MADGRLRSTAYVLSQVYPQAVAGTPLRFSFSPQTDVFAMAYVPNHRIHAPTLIFVPTRCTTATATAPAPPGPA